MTFVSLSIPAWPTDAARSTELARRALLIAPRIRLEPVRRLLWADARGLAAPVIAAHLVELARSLGDGEGASGDPVSGPGNDDLERPARYSGPKAGVADTPIAALVAARHGPDPITVVPPGGDRAFLAPFDPEVLDPPPPNAFYPLLAGIGIERLADLAALDPQSVEIRFGAEGVRLWKLARADDPRPIFASTRRELPNAELEWVDYELADQEQVVFIVNSLLATVTDALAARREGAHAVVLEFGLADRSRVELPIKAAHPTAERRTWLRVIRAALEPVTFAAPVLRIGLRVEQASALSDRQGDLFDSGFATARATEAALEHLLDKQPDAVVVARRIQHPLPERRIDWRSDPSGLVTERTLPGAGGGADPVPHLSVQLFPAPRTIDVRTVSRRGAPIPDRYFDGTRSYSLSASLGPDRVSGGFGGDRYERDYFQGVRHDGVMVLLYRDLGSDTWSLAGWWD